MLSDQWEPISLSFFCGSYWCGCTSAAVGRVLEISWCFYSDLISSYVEQGQVMLYIKQKTSVHLTVSSHCHWSRNSGGFWRKEVIYLLRGQEKPHSGLPDTSGNVPPVFSRHWISPNMRFTLVMGYLPRQETPPQLESRLVCQQSTEFIDFRLLLQVGNHWFSPAFPV